MAWLEGLLTGWSDASRDIRQEEFRRAELQNQREEKLYYTLLNSPDPEIQALAATGLLQSSQLPKWKGSLGRILAETEQNPAYAQILASLQRPRTVTERTYTKVPGLPSRQGFGATPTPTLPAPNNPAGMIDTPPDQTGSAALPANSPTEVGAPPPTPVEPMPLASPGLSPFRMPPPRPPFYPATGQVATEAPISRSALFAPSETEPGLAPQPTFRSSETAFEPEPAPEPVAPPAPPPPPPFAFRDVAAPTVGRVDVGERTVSRLPRAFPTAEDLAASQTRGRGLGEYEYLVEMYRRVGDPDPEAAAAKLLESKIDSDAGILRGNVIPDPDNPGAYLQQILSRSTGQVLRTIPAAAPGAPGAAAPQLRDLIAARRYGQPNEDPRVILRSGRLTPKQLDLVFEEERQELALRALERAKAVSGVGLSTYQKFQATEAMSGRWTALNRPVRDMERAYGEMTVGLDRFTSDPIGASQAILVTFQKILDPTSVVREGEYDRSPAGLSILARIQGMYQRYIGQWDPVAQRWTGGGAGVPIAELKEMTETARQFLAGLKDFNENERQRLIGRAAALDVAPADILGPNLGVITVPPPYGQIVATPPPPPVTPPPGGGGAGRAGAGGGGAGGGGGVTLDTPIVVNPDGTYTVRP